MRLLSVLVLGFCSSLCTAFINPVDNGHRATLIASQPIVQSGIHEVSGTAVRLDRFNYVNDASSAGAIIADNTTGVAFTASFTPAALEAAVVLQHRYAGYIFMIPPRARKSVGPAHSRFPSNVFPTDVNGEPIQTVLSASRGKCGLAPGVRCLGVELLCPRCRVPPP